MTLKFKSVDENKLKNRKDEEWFQRVLFLLSKAYINKHNASLLGYKVWVGPNNKKILPENRDYYLKTMEKFLIKFIAETAKSQLKSTTGVGPNLEFLKAC